MKRLLQNYLTKNQKNAHISRMYLKSLAPPDKKFVVWEKDTKRSLQNIETDKK